MMRNVSVYLVLIICGLAAGPALALDLKTGKDIYARDELVDIVASLGVSETADVYPADLQAKMWQGQKLILSVGQMRQVPLRVRADGTWRGFWPIPFDPALGHYHVQVRCLSLADGATVTARAGFAIQGRKPYALPPGFSVVTDEGGKHSRYETPGFSPGDPTSWRNVVAWADTMGADALWQCIGQTQVWGELKPEQFPWGLGMITLMKKEGEAAHQAGMKYGAWITAFVVIGDTPTASGYRFTLGYDRKTQSLRPLRYVSLGCERRIADLIGLLKQFEAAPEIDYLGLDYMRTDFGGYEFATDFVRDMSINAPAEWAGWSETERGVWMAKLLEVTRNPEARERWAWWRAHKVGQIVRRIKDEVKPTKPLWVFSLGWKTGHQHGQDVDMMLDAGIDFNAPMFYSIEKTDFPEMLRDWDTYLRRAPASIVVGECVDWNLFDRTLSPAGPQEHFDRQRATVQKLIGSASSFGLFWHDLARAFWGARGPYGTWEWVVAGAATFSEAKAAAGRISYRLTLRAPATLMVHQPAEIHVDVANTSGTTLTGVSVDMLPLPRLDIIGPAKLRFANLPPQGQPSRVTFRCRTDQVFAANSGVQMVAVRASCAQDAPRDTYTAFIYLPVAAEAGTTPTAVATLADPPQPNPKHARRHGH